MNKIFDVVVIGAGPAGAQAAEEIAKGGRSVALIDRKESPSMPVRCGEGVGFKGMNASIGIKDEWILDKINKVAFISPSGLRVDVENIGESFCIDRTKMDRELVDRAIEAGATYINNTYIEDIETEIKDNQEIYKSISEDNIFESKLLVLADGVESRLKNLVGWDYVFKLEDMESCAFAKIKSPNIKAGTIEFFVGEDIAPGGYLWVFPRGEGVANIGLGVLGTLSKPGLAKQLLNKYIKENFAEAEVFDFHVGGVPVAHWIKPLVKKGVLIAGDTAGQVNALNGGGIAYALFAGKTVGETINEAWIGDNLNLKKLKRYEKKWNRYCGKNQARSYALKTVLLKNRDSYYNDIARILKDEDPKKLSYMRVFRKVFAKHPLLLMKVFWLFK